MSEERNLYDTQAIPKFFSYLKEGNSVLDVGKANDDLTAYYRKMFPGMNYKTSDIELAKKPDIIDDIEHTQIPEESFDAVVCMGVWEMCNGNPFDLYKGLMKILKKEGYFLFGIKLTAIPPDWNYDWIRFTIPGVKRLLKDNKILDEFVFNRAGIPSYIFIVGQK